MEANRPGVGGMKVAPPLVQLRDIRLTFGGAPLLAGVDLTVEAGDQVCLIGRNGSGKSTLLKIAAGLVEPDSGSRFVQPGATIRYLPQEPDFGGFATTLAYVEAGLGPATIAIRRAICWSSSGSRRRRPRRSCPAARRAARRWRGCWRPRPTSCCSTSRPTISISPPSNGWRANSTAAAARWSSSAMTGASSPTCRARPPGSIAARSGRSIAAFSAFEAWRDEVLAEEERDQHKLDRKIVNEEHWLRYGVSGRRKRNVKRLGNLHALREQRRDYRGAAGNANLAARKPTNPASW
jgi:ATP-binding cassette subfamily F protein uup